MVGLIEFLGDAIVFFLVMRLVWRVIQSFTAAPPATKRGRPQPTPERAGGTLVRCPQCGTYVPESRAVRVGSGSTSNAFCSVACRDEYAARPVSPPASQPSAHVH
jgi:hypothetical protein